MSISISKTNMYSKDGEYVAAQVHVHHINDFWAKTSSLNASSQDFHACDILAPFAAVVLIQVSKIPPKNVTWKTNQHIGGCLWRHCLRSRLYFRRSLCLCRKQSARLNWPQPFLSTDPALTVKHWTRDSIMFVIPGPFLAFTLCVHTTGS